VVAASHQTIPGNWCYYVPMLCPMDQSQFVMYGVQEQVPWFSQQCQGSMFAAINGMEAEEEKKKSKRRKGTKKCIIDPNVPEIPVEQRTTVMMRNIPYCFTREMLWALLDSKGFNSHYDFVYLPTDFYSQQSLGYAFINFLSHEDALACFEVFSGFQRWDSMKSKVYKPCTVNWGHPYQGLEAHVMRYRNSPVMHEDVPEEARPAVFVNGVPVTFPAPTKKIDKPRWKHNARIGSHKEETYTDQ